MRHVSLRRRLAVSLGCWLIAGCAAREMVLVDPRMDLEHEVGKRVLVMPVQAQVPFPSDASAATVTALRECLGQEAGLSLCPGDAAEPSLAGQVPVDAETIRSLAAKHEADVVVIARVPEFWERQLKDFAQRHSLFAGDALNTNSSWSDRPRAEVLLKVIVAFYEGSTGRLLWQREAMGGESEEAPLAETPVVFGRLYRTVAKQIGEQVVSDLHPFFTYH